MTTITVRIGDMSSSLFITQSAAYTAKCAACRPVVRLPSPSGCRTSVSISLRKHSSTDRPFVHPPTQQQQLRTRHNPLDGSAKGAGCVVVVGTDGRTGGSKRSPRPDGRAVVRMSGWGWRFRGRSGVSGTIIAERCYPSNSPSYVSVWVCVVPNLQQERATDAFVVGSDR